MSEIKTILKIKHFPLDHSKNTYDYDEMFKAFEAEIEPEFKEDFNTDELKVNVTDNYIVLFAKIMLSEIWGGQSSFSDG